MRCLDLVGLTPLMRRSRGASAIPVGLIDGPVDLKHAELAASKLRAVGTADPRCHDTSSAACHHGTQVALLLSGIVPRCALSIRPIFFDAEDGAQLPRASASELSRAILDCVDAGLRLLNISAGLPPSVRIERRLDDALNHAAAREVLIVAAAGNQAMIASSAITRHPAVLSVAACDLQGAPLERSNLSGSIGRAGLMAPGASINGALGGTSAAAAFVTGALALLWSEFPDARPADLRYAVTRTATGARRSVTPRLLNAWAAFHTMHGTAPRSVAS
jgi:subtilisin family serine protease